MKIRIDNQRRSLARTVVRATAVRAVVVRAVVVCVVGLLVAGCQHQRWQDVTGEACDGDFCQEGDGSCQYDDPLFQKGDGSWQGGGGGSVEGGRRRPCDNGECGPLCRLASGEHYSRYVDEHLASHEAVRRANRSMRAIYAQAPSFDFRDGYRHAFVEVALGGDGQVPSVPPERYWGTCYRTAAGHQLAQDWFAGYVCGSGRALSMYRYLLNEVATSGLSGLEETTSVGTSWPPPTGPPSRWADEAPPQW